MRKTSKGSKAPVKTEQPPADEGVDDVKVKAVNEMMERIKHGVILRPVKSQNKENKRSAVKQPPSSEEKPHESAMEELKGILDTVKKSPSRGSQDSGSSLPGKKDSELEVILRRRRNKAGEAGSGDDGQLSHVSSTDSLNGQRTSSDSGKEAEGPGSLNAPSDSSGPKVNLERRSSGPGPIVPRRKSSDTGQTSRVGSWQDRRSCSSLTERESLFNNGCVNSVEEYNKIQTEKCINPNEVIHGGSVEDTQAAVCTGPLEGGVDAEC
ncbi:uncharacterized protein LOC103399025 [Cynoglossus semilaevis]|uniref:uncharacterized protein LOC103399025 n=1 Tax=Cynoglossus semilaevis TaxID=244447 RepID=UPI000497F299|nr:uncharacterized protein LOC103399025 [Cynoglossus semilaevis]